MRPILVVIAQVFSQQPSQVVHRQNQECAAWASRRVLSKDRKLAGGRRVALLPAKDYLHLTAELAVRTWLLVALNEVNRRVQFFRQKLTQAAAA